MDTEQIGKIARDASMAAIERYLEMCGLDSPWEVPEAFLATESAKAAGLRVALEFRLDRASNRPSAEHINRHGLQAIDQ